jgi:hypothetical protein
MIEVRSYCGGGLTRRLYEGPLVHGTGLHASMYGSKFPTRVIAGPFLSRHIIGQSTGMGLVVLGRPILKNFDSRVPRRSGAPDRARAPQVFYSTLFA